MLLRATGMPACYAEGGYTAHETIQKDKQYKAQALPFCPPRACIGRSRKAEVNDPILAQ
ncbi:MAG: hypothetical protein HC934_02080 [Acaryochloridaceae cyanobacterium SU_2_1]|nr:hypothetical protein [Acaryochloridaceae cyanobacterium SU_2_1]